MSGTSNTERSLANLEQNLTNIKRSIAAKRHEQIERLKGRISMLEKSVNNYLAEKDQRFNSMQKAIEDLHAQMDTFAELKRRADEVFNSKVELTRNYIKTELSGLKAEREDCETTIVKNLDSALPELHAYILAAYKPTDANKKQLTTLPLKIQALQGMLTTTPPPSPPLGGLTACSNALLLERRLFDSDTVQMHTRLVGICEQTNKRLTAEKTERVKRLDHIRAMFDNTVKVIEAADKVREK